MKKQHLLFATFILAGSLTVSGQTPDTADSLSAQRTLTIDEVVVTGTRHQTDIRHLSQTVSVVNRKRIEQSMQPSLLPVLTEQVPGLFTTSRGVMGYGVSNGAAGGISLRGLSGGNARLMVLIDGHLNMPASSDIRLPMPTRRSWPTGWRYCVARHPYSTVRMPWVA